MAKTEIFMKDEYGERKRIFDLVKRQDDWFCIFKFGKLLVTIPLIDLKKKIDDIAKETGTSA